MAFTKITPADLVDKGVIGLPDTPELNTTEMQEKFDEIALEVLVPAHNALVDELDSAFTGKMDKANPTGTGSISFNMNQYASIGEKSATFNNSSQASGQYAFASGSSTSASGIGSFSANGNTSAKGDYSFSHGISSSAIGQGSKASGEATCAFGSNSSSNGEGVFYLLYSIATITVTSIDSTTKRATCSLSETDSSFIEGAILEISASRSEYFAITSVSGTTVELDCSQSDYLSVGLTIFQGNYSIYGNTNIAIGKNSTTDGEGTIAGSDNQKAEGKYNVPDFDGEYAHIIGGGLSDNDRKNIFTVDWEGNVKADGDITDGSDNVLSEKADKATTLAGYGITDAKIENGTIRLGNETLTPITEPFTRNADGLVPKSGSATTHQYLRSDGVWAKPDDESVSKKDITGLDYDYDLLLTGHESGDRTGNALHSTDIYFNAKEKDLHVEKINGIVVDNILPTDTESGNPAVITDAFGGACKSLKLTLEPIQSGSGTPSPSNVRPISGRSSLKISRTQKNLLPYSLASLKVLNSSGSWSDNVYTINGVTYTVNVDSNGFLLGIVANGTASANADFLIWMKNNADSGLIPMTYKMNGCPDGGATDGSTYFMGYYSPGKSQYNFGGSGINIVVAENDAIGSNIFCRIANGYNAQNKEFEPMLRLTSITDYSYEPYNGESITITFGQTVYGGTCDVLSGEMVIDRAIIDLGTKDWNSASSVGRVNSVVAISGAVNPSANVNKADMICNKYEVLPYYVDGQQGHDANSTLNSMAIFASNNNTVFIYDSALANMTGAQVKTALSGTIVCYKLASPITVQLTPKQISLLHGDNVLTTDADSIEASYSADVALYIEKKIAEGSNNNRSVDNSSLSKGGSSETEGEDVKSIVPDTKDVLMKKTDSSESEER